MSKILRNDNPSSAVDLFDVGVSIPGGASYTIPPQDYPQFAASSDVIEALSDDLLILNDGGNDITNLSDAVDIIKGWFPRDVDDAFTGETLQFAGLVGVLPIPIPNVPGNTIKTALIRCPSQTPLTNRLLYSLDDGTTFHTLAPGEFIGWSLRGDVLQIQIKGNVENVEYEVTLNVVTL